MTRFQKRGVSLTECLVAIALSISVLSTATTLLHRMFHHQQSSRDDARFQIETSRLAATFRRDVGLSHRCGPLENAAGKGILLTELGGNVIAYSATENWVLRERQTEVGIAHRDEFVLPQTCTLQFIALEEQDNSEPTMVQLRLRWANYPWHSSGSTFPADAEFQREVVIEAALGRNSHWNNEQ